MFEIRKPTKRLKEICASFGDEYSIQVVNSENVLYRDLKNGYDFEISGLNHNSQKVNATIYVWKDKIRCVETIYDIHSLSRLADTLTELAYKYSNI